MTASATVYRSPELPWGLSPEEERRFRRLSTLALLIFVMLALIIPNLNIPEPERRTSEKVSPRLAQLVLERKETPPPPPKVEDQKPDAPKPKEEPEPVNPERVKPKPEATPQPPSSAITSSPVEPVDRTAIARENASRAGLLAMKDELAGLRDNPAVNNAVTNSRLSTGGAQTTERSLITAGVTKGSGGIDAGRLSRDAGNTKLAGRTTTAVTSELADREAKGGKKTRSRESIDVVLDRVKGALKSIYQRELRTDPSLQGTVVFELKIDPSGSPLVRVVSSALPDSLASKLAARIKSFDFGAQNVEPVTLTWDVDFQPDM